MKNLQILFGFILTLLTICLYSHANAQDPNHVFKFRNYKFHIAGTPNASNDYISMSIKNDNSSISGRIYQMTSTRLQGNLTGKTNSSGAVHGEVNWSVAPDAIKKASFFYLYKEKGSTTYRIQFYTNNNYMRQKNAKPVHSMNLNIESTSNPISTATASTTNKSTSSTTAKKTVTVRVHYKFIFLSSSYYWPKLIANELINDYRANIFGTGSIRAYSETAASTQEIPAKNNHPARVFDIPKSKAMFTFQKHYYDNQKKRSWGGSEPEKYGFYSFAQDAEFKQLDPKFKVLNHSSDAIFPISRTLEFVVNKDALQAKNERVAINVQAHITTKKPIGDLKFGNMHRKVYLHELLDPNKLTALEKKHNRKLEGSGHKNASEIMPPPYYFFAAVNNQVYAVFTVEILE